MKKNALRKFLGIYHLIQDDVKEERTETVIQLYGRKKKICMSGLSGISTRSAGKVSITTWKQGFTMRTEDITR